MDSGLRGKVAVVTGAAGGIGGATAVELAEHGVKVLLVDVRGDEAAAKAEAIVAAGGEASAFTADVSTEDGVAGYVEAAVERYGTIDLFHNNAALEGPFLPLVDYDLETFDRLVAVNIRGVFLGLRAVLPVLLEKGSGAIVNTASIASYVGFPNLAAYTATKHAVAGFTKAVALEVATTGVRVNAVSPGVIDTGAWDAFGEQGKADYFADIAARNPARRIGTPGDIAQAVLFALTNTFLTGQTLHVDGGEPLT